MCGQLLASPDVPVSDIDLQAERVRLHVHDRCDRGVLIADLLGAGDVQCNVDLTVELLQGRFVSTEAGRLRDGTAVDPAVAEAVGLEHRGEPIHAGDRVLCLVAGGRVVRPTQGVFDVPHVLTQRAQTVEVVEELGDHPA